MKYVKGEVNSPCNHNIFPIGLCLEALHDIEANFGSSHPVWLRLLCEKSNLSGQLCNRLWRAGVLDDIIAEKVEVANLI